jgi:hypothetical protein
MDGMDGLEKDGWMDATRWMRRRGMASQLIMEQGNS